jgi:hypothetical protein
METSSLNDGMNCVCRASWIEFMSQGEIGGTMSSCRTEGAQKDSLANRQKLVGLEAEMLHGVVDTAHSKGQAWLCSGAICDAQFAARTPLLRNLQHDITETESPWALRAGS